MRIVKRLKEIQKQLKNGKGIRLESGFFAESTYPDGQPVASVALANDMGVPSRNQPPRPFFRNCIEDNKQKWMEMLIKLIANGDDFETALGKVGVIVREDIQQSIMDFSSPALKESTVKAKMRGNKKRNIPSLSEPDARNPLEHTFLMRDSVESRITKDES